MVKKKKFYCKYDYHPGIDISITEEMLDYAHELATKTEWLKNTTYEQKRIGFLGEIAVCKWLNVRWPPLYEQKSDGGFDIELYEEYKFDVKTNTRGNYHWYLSEKLIERQKSEFIIFCSYLDVDKKIRILGYKRSCTFLKYGKCSNDFYLITEDDLDEHFTEHSSSRLIERVIANRISDKIEKQKLQRGDIIKHYLDVI